MLSPNTKMRHLLLKFHTYLLEISWFSFSILFGNYFMGKYKITWQNKIFFMLQLEVLDPFLFFQMLLIKFGEAALCVALYVSALEKTLPRYFIFIVFNKRCETYLLSLFLIWGKFTLTSLDFPFLLYIIFTICFIACNILWHCCQTFSFHLAFIHCHYHRCLLLMTVNGWAGDSYSLHHGRLLKFSLGFGQLTWMSQDSFCLCSQNKCHLSRSDAYLQSEGLDNWLSSWRCSSFSS